MDLCVQDNYEAFIRQKRLDSESSGFEVSPDAVNQNLFDWQQSLVRLALRKGRFGGYQDCGLGKTIQQLESARLMWDHTKKPVLIFCPLAVAPQTLAESEKFSIEADVTICKSQKDVKDGINLANYERVHLFDASQFSGLVLDEGSILKSLDGKTKRELLQWNTDYRQSWSATPAPNDYMELGNQSQFLGQLTHTEMLSTFFVHDGGETSKWRLEFLKSKLLRFQDLFWRWMANWAVVMRSPYDFGYDGSGFNLPPIEYVDSVVNSPRVPGKLFADAADTLSDRREARKLSLRERCVKAVELAESSNGPCVIWCNLNAEGELLARLMPDAVEVAGRHSIEQKEDRLSGFTTGQIRTLITKPRIGGFGLNWQHCNTTVIFPTDSYEQWYQMVRRFYRFGQKSKVTVHSVYSESEINVVENLRRKERDIQDMFRSVSVAMSDATKRELKLAANISKDYVPKVKQEIPKWM